MAESAIAAARPRRCVSAPDTPPIDLAVGRGEIVGLAGLEGHGQEAFLEVAVRPAPARGGRRSACRRRDGPVAVTGLAQAARHGIAYLPRDRRATGIFPGQSVFDNFAIAALPRHATARHRPARARCAGALTGFRERLSMVYGCPSAAIGTLSGGNQQKVLLARWLALRAAHPAAQRSDARGRSRHPAEALRGLSRPRPRRGHAAGRALQRDRGGAAALRSRAGVPRAGSVARDIGRPAS